MIALILAVAARAACPDITDTLTCARTDGCGLFGTGPGQTSCQNCSTYATTPISVLPFGCKVVNETIVPMTTSERECYNLLNSGVCNSAAATHSCGYICMQEYVPGWCCFPCSVFNPGSLFHFDCDTACYGVYDNTCTATRAPTTLAPTTVAPTSHQPTTFSPTTIAPTTLAPTTAGEAGNPVTNAPVTFAPTALVPTSHAPVTVAPTTHAPIDHTAAPTSAAQGSDTSLSTGDIAAIAVGAVLAVVLVASVVLFVQKRNGTAGTTADVGNRYAAL